MDSKNYHEDISHIRSMMERGSRFLSLSGLSGAFAGSVALMGSAFVYFKLKNHGIDYIAAEDIGLPGEIVFSIIWTGILMLLLAVFVAYFLSVRRSKKINQPIWSTATRHMLLDFLVPLVTGAVFCIGLIYHNLFIWIAPTTLVFYGLALISAEKHTLSDIKYLGFCQIILGLISVFFPGSGLVCWALGFGVLHIVYGLMMHRKYSTTNN